MHREQQRPRPDATSGARKSDAGSAQCRGTSGAFVVSTSTHRPRWRCADLAAAVGLVLAGCAVGPDFKPPSVPATTAGHPYTAMPLPESTASTAGAGGAAQRFAPGQDVPALWWQVFQSPALDQLIRSAIERSPTLASAQAALRQAQALYAADAGSKQLPGVTGQLGATRERASQISSLEFRLSEAEFPL